MSGVSDREGGASKLELIRCVVAGLALATPAFAERRKTFGVAGTSPATAWERQALRSD